MKLLINKHDTLLRAASVSIIIITVFTLFLSGIGWAADASLKDNAFHYMANGVDDQLYNEWWCFDAVDNNTTLQLVYLLSDPDNISSERKIQVHAAVIEDGLPHATGQRQSRGYGGDRNSPMFDIDKSGFSLEDDENMHVWGEVENNATGEPIRWDMIYQPIARPWFAIPVLAHIGQLKSNWIKWLVYMPSAQVAGTLSIGNRTISLQGTGYHEHVWGRFVISDPQITRASVSVPLDGFSLTFAEIKSENKVAFIGIEKDENSIVFRDTQIRFNNSNVAYEFDNITAAVYPAVYHVVADNGDYTLDLTVDVQDSASTVLDYLPPSPGVLIFQLASILQGTVKSKSGEVFDFRKKGFSAFIGPRLNPNSKLNSS